MSSELVQYQNATLDQRTRYATTIAGAGDLIPRGLFDPATGKPSPGKILLVLETGAMLNLAPMAALQGIDVIEGRATISPQLMTGLIRAAGHKIEIIKTGSISGGDYAVTVRGTRADDGSVFEAVWDVHRAVRAGLCKYEQGEDGIWRVIARSKNDNPLPWESYTEAMLKARAISEVGREGFDDVLKGIAYTSEEIHTSVSLYAEPEPSEDWAGQIDAAESVEELQLISVRLADKKEGTDALRTRWLAKLGVLKRQAETTESAPEEDSEVIEDAEVVEAPETVESSDSVEPDPSLDDEGYEKWLKEQGNE